MEWWLYLLIAIWLLPSIITTIILWFHPYLRLLRDDWRYAPVIIMLIPFIGQIGLLFFLFQDLKDHYTTGEYKMGGEFLVNKYFT